MNAIEIKNVSYAYEDRKALHSVSFNIKSGIVFALLGPNGGGKSTLLNILSTLLKLQEGSISCFGRSLGEDPNEFKSNVGVVFQNPALDKKLSILENLLHHGSLYHISRIQLKKKCETLLNFLSLADRQDEKVETLSGGLKRRVEIAKSLIHSPKLLILDEPTTGLDPIVRKEIWRDLRKQQALEKTTIVFTTHLLEEADAADRVVMLHQGKIVAEGSPFELKASLGSETLVLKCKNAKELSFLIENKLGFKPLIIDDEVRIQAEGKGGFLPLITQLIETFRDQFESLTLGTPTLEDLFLFKTGRRITHEPSMTGYRL